MNAKGKTVLLVEDNEDNMLIYSTILRHHGYEVLEATDGEMGLETARTRLPDMILMDISIPKMDGWEVTRRLKADPATAHIPIVALTAHALITDETRARDIGCDGYIPKPAEPALVVKTVRSFVGEAKPA